MLSTVFACAVLGLDGQVVEVQTDFNPRATIPNFTIVGLPGSAVKESRDRVRSAIKNSQLAFPNKMYVVNLSPADLPKMGPAYDLAIAVGVLAATDQVPLEPLRNALFVGELSLDGSVRHVRGVMPIVYAAREAGFDTVYIPEEDKEEAGLIPNITIIPLQGLGQLVEHLYGLNPIAPHVTDVTNFGSVMTLPPDIVDFRDIRGQEYVKRALEIAAAGNHNVLLSGPPGAGKSLMARAMPGILPRLSLEEALEVAKIYSVANLLTSKQPLDATRPFRAPHHTTSQAGLVGGGSIPKPGEISLAHRGVLFLDEIVEYPQKVLEVLRQPIEDKIVTISRAQGTVTFPANFLLVAARNPCPCGYYGDKSRACTCAPGMVQRYQNRLSGPLMDRIDIHVDVSRVEYDKLLAHESATPSAEIRARVETARARQHKRFQELDGIYANADMTTTHIQTYCQMDDDAQQLLGLSVKRMALSARSYHRVLKLSRTVADLTGADRIGVTHVAEALQYRPKALEL